jgi:hypothetical protein
VKGGSPAVVPAEGTILEHILQAEHQAGRYARLSRHAYQQFEAAQMKTPWGRAHRRRFALVGDGAAPLASATRHSFAAVLDRKPIRVCAISDVLADPEFGDDGHAAELVERLFDAAAQDGDDLALLFSHGSTTYGQEGFEPIPMTDLTLGIAQSARHGAPMALIRGGEPRDSAAIVAMGRVRASIFRFHLDRDVDLLEHAIARKRLLAGLGPAGARELHFFIAEEGITAAAYVAITVTGESWNLEECGDRDPSGARVGAILQALIAREPAERRPVVRAWLPPDFLPPQIAILSAQPAATRIDVRRLGEVRTRLGLSAADVLYWRNDCLHPSSPVTSR